VTKPALQTGPRLIASLTFLAQSRTCPVFWISVDLSTLFDASLLTSEPPHPRLIFFALFRSESEALR